MEAKCFVICTALLLQLKVNFPYFEIQIFILLKLESESAMQKICNKSGIQIRWFFGRIAIPACNISKIKNN